MYSFAGDRDLRGSTLCLSFETQFSKVSSKVNVSLRAGSLVWSLVSGAG